MLDILGDQLYLQSDNDFTFYSKSDTCEKLIRQNFNKYPREEISGIQECRNFPDKVQHISKQNIF